MISVAPVDRDALRFMWAQDVEAEQPEIVVLRFAQVVFGVSASPFLLNATIAHHMQRYQVDDGPFVEHVQFLR